MKKRKKIRKRRIQDIYTDEEKEEDPEKEDTGLFFFRGEPGAKTAVVNAGGGFVYVAAMHDSFPQALELARRGYNAFALIYRPGADTACEDLARAIAFLHENADELQIDMTDYSLWGGSEVTGAEPPTYACVGTNDGIVSYRSMEYYISRIQENGTDAEIQVFDGLRHGFGLGEGTDAEGWLDNAVSFWERNMKE